VSSARIEAIVVGASAGALDALSAILPALPAAYPLPLILVVHLPPGKDSLLADILGAKCNMKVREADDKEVIEAGTTYVAPPDYHVLVEHNRTLSLSSEEEVHFSRPSIDVLFESAADAYGAGLAGVVLTGANEDGANGLRAIVEAGGIAVVQQPSTALSAVMPQAALAACPDARVLAPAAIAGWLKTLSNEREQA
jgi:two-component system chemotaxis response regulator CheB